MRRIRRGAATNPWNVAMLALLGLSVLVALVEIANVLMASGAIPLWVPVAVWAPRLVTAMLVLAGLAVVVTAILILTGRTSAGRRR